MRRKKKGRVSEEETNGVRKKERKREREREKARERKRE